ncbi:hypothetical protein HDU87_005486 [Geranomyces variabilis]|uniref:glutathione gamma-glutamylcysteinyltransferase n=1 Tax=Geranomyces variabilis TaxID=109894 RepID=A0AAD5XPP7_9FUNG|nr:hypothetical protein HDU87_005486 [Geranomyces variabilis]
MLAAELEGVGSEGEAEVVPAPAFNESLIELSDSEGDRATKESFLRVIERTSREPNEFLVVSYDRGTLSQTGSGHFSPVGGYNAAEKMVLILDVARFKESWPGLCDILFKQLPKQFVKSPPESPAEFIKIVIDHIPDAYDSVVENRLPLFLGPAEPGPGVVDPITTTSSAASSPAASEAFNSYLRGLDDLLHKLAATPLYRLVDASLSAKKAEAKRRVPMGFSKAEPNDTAPAASPPTLQLRSTFADSPFTAISSPPMSPRYSLNFAARRSSSNLNPTAIASSPSVIHPVNHPLNDFTAFLSIFLFALFSYKPMHEELVDIVEEEPGNTGDSAQKAAPAFTVASSTFPTAGARRPEKRRLSMAEQVNFFLNIEIQDTVIREEVAFLRNQIAALTELTNE